MASDGQREAAQKVPPCDLGAQAHHAWLREWTQRVSRAGFGEPSWPKVENLLDLQVISRAGLGLRVPDQRNMYAENK